MIDNSIIQTTTSWPFVEARKLIKERKKIFEKKGKIILQTGYGPSGLPHIGTFGEVARTTMIVNAIRKISSIPTEIITFSDDSSNVICLKDYKNGKLSMSPTVPPHSTINTSRSSASAIALMRFLISSVMCGMI